MAPKSCPCWSPGPVWLLFSLPPPTGPQDRAAGSPRWAALPHSQSCAVSVMGTAASHMQAPPCRRTTRNDGRAPSRPWFLALEPVRRWQTAPFPLQGLSWTAEPGQRMVHINVHLPRIILRFCIFFPSKSTLLLINSTNVLPGPPALPLVTERADSVHPPTWNPYFVSMSVASYEPGIS